MNGGEGRIIHSRRGSADVGKSIFGTTPNCVNHKKNSFSAVHTFSYIFITIMDFITVIVITLEQIKMPSSNSATPSLKLDCEW